MGYKMSTYGMWEIKLEKYTEQKGFFRNTAGPLKIGEICLVDQTNELFEDFLTKNDEIYYMELGCIDGFDFIYRGEAPQISIGDKKHNIPVEDRIKFIYESLSCNTNYNCLEIIYKSPDYMMYTKVLFEIEFDGYGCDDDFYDATLFVIKDL